MTRPTSSGGGTLFGPTRADSLRRSVDVGAMPSSPRLKPQLGRAVFSPVGVGMPSEDSSSRRACFARDEHRVCTGCVCVHWVCVCTVCVCTGCVCALGV